MNTSLLDNPLLLPSNLWRITHPMSPSFKPSFPFFSMWLVSIKSNQRVLSQSLSDRCLLPRWQPQQKVKCTPDQIIPWEKKYYDDSHEGKKLYLKKKKMESLVKDRPCSDFGWHYSKHTHWLHLTVASWLVHWCYWTGLKHRKHLVS